MKLGYKEKLELGVAAVVALIGVFFVVQASFIRPALNDPIGPKVLPMTIAIALVVGGALIAIRALTHAAGPMHDGYGFLESNVRRIAAVIGCGVVYVVLFWGIGYFAATLASVFLIMLAFGNRNYRIMTGVAVFAAFVYQFVFMGLMGLHDPRGALADLRPLTNWLTGA